MACRTQTVKTLAYDYCPDDLPIQSNRMQSIISARFIDELTGNEIVSQLTVSSEMDKQIYRTKLNGVAGLVANPFKCFPGLASNSVEVDMSVSAKRFLSQSFVSQLGPFNTLLGFANDFPDIFMPIELGDVGMHREASRIKGRCVINTAVGRTPVAGANVTFSGLWHMFPAANIDPLVVVEQPNIVSLLHGLYSQRIAGTDQIRQRDLSPLVGEEKTLLSSTQPGDTVVHISNRVNLLAGQILAFEVAHNDLVEYIEIIDVNGLSTDTQPATVTLAYPLSKAHREGVTVVRVNPQAPASSNNFLRDGIQKDQTIFLDALTDLTDSTVEVFGTGNAEYHRMNLYSVISDAQGYFSLPFISRVAMIQIQASALGVPQDAEIIFSPDYELFENQLDLFFS